MDRYPKELIRNAIAKYPKINLWLIFIGGISYTGLNGIAKGEEGISKEMARFSKRAVPDHSVDS